MWLPEKRYLIAPEDFHPSAVIIRDALPPPRTSTASANTIACSEGGIHLCLMVNKAEKDGESGMKEKKGVRESVVLKYHQGFLSEFFRSNLPVMLNLPSGPPTPTPRHKATTNNKV